jgi:hypothetical protein
MELKVQSRVSLYTVSYLPEDHVDSGAFSVYVRRVPRYDSSRDREEWVVSRSLTSYPYLSNDMHWHYGPSCYDSFFATMEPTEWTDEEDKRYDLLTARFHKEHFFTMDVALGLAEEFLPTMKINGRNAQEIFGDE